MMLGEAESGDWVVIDLHGDEVFVEVGRVYGRAGTKKRAFEPSGVMVDRLDPLTLFRIPFSDNHAFPTSLLDPDVVVVARVASIVFLRRLRYVGPVRHAIALASKAGDDDRSDVDPLARMHDRATSNALLEWRQERREKETDDDIPF